MHIVDLLNKHTAGVFQLSDIMTEEVLRSELDDMTPSEKKAALTAAGEDEDDEDANPEHLLRNQTVEKVVVLDHRSRSQTPLLLSGRPLNRTFDNCCLFGRRDESTGKLLPFDEEAKLRCFFSNLETDSATNEIRPMRKRKFVTGDAESNSRWLDIYYLTAVCCVPRIIDLSWGAREELRKYH